MNIYEKADSILKDLYGPDAKFRDGQFEAIEATLSHKRTFVVQRTGWGKSLVYFVCTKILREQKKGVTLVVSPLLVLMENQMDAAQKMGLLTDVLNYTTKDRREEILSNLIEGKVDIIFITPETLFKDDVQEAISKINIGLFVIDEAHCISDWGHDFRLEYSNLVKVIALLPKSVPILATTATANNRVVEDLKTQLGGDVFVSRGPLTRQSLVIDVLNLPDRAKRYAWLLKNINSLPGTGIIYCLTKRDCDYISDFLNKNSINAMPYYSSDKDDEMIEQAIANFQNNKIKVIVATIKLGMGYDKGDIGFVIHFQCPSNIISYYQQIGRAGRNLDTAYAILMFGKEDKTISEYFIETAFPKRTDCEKILSIVRDHNGLSVRSIGYFANIPLREINKSLMFLRNEEAVFLDNGKYYATANQYTYNEEHYHQIQQQKLLELKKMEELFSTKECLSKFIVNCLDDFEAIPCKKCYNCTHKHVGEDFTELELDIALNYLNSIIIPILPRKKWPHEGIGEKLTIDFVNEEGIALCKYGDAGYGELVKRGKYVDKKFCDELVGKSASVLKDFVKQNNITTITFVPSLRSDLVKDFAQRLAKSLKLEFKDLLYKTPAGEQKLMKNSSFQCNNAFNSFYAQNVQSENILLVDDMVDSKWTMTVCGYKLIQAGALKVFPFALADSSINEV